MLSVHSLLVTLLAIQSPGDVDVRPPLAVARLSPPGLQLGDGFGYSVALEDDTLAVGAPFRDAVESNAGAVYVFERDALGVWEEVVELLPPFSGRLFGWSVTLAGDVLAVGAPGFNYPVRNGAVFVYERSGGLWTLVATILGEPSSELGFSVLLDGDRLAAGGIGCEPLNCDPHERVVVHERDVGGPSAWGRTAQLGTPSSPAFTCDGFGRSLDLEGDRLAVGSSHYTGACWNDHVYLYERGSSGGWGLSLDLAAPSSFLRFGYPVVLSGELLAVGAWLSIAPAVKGVNVYLDDPGSLAWELVAQIPTGGLPSGESHLALQGSLLVAGNARNNELGQVSLFLRNQGGPNAFGLARRFSAEDGVPNDDFGYAVALSGSMLAVGAPHNRVPMAGPGAVYLYELQRPRPPRAIGKPLPF